MAKSVRLPTSKDVDEYGMVLMQVNGPHGPKIKRLPAVDAREIILADEGTLDLNIEVVTEKAQSEQNLAVFATMDINELRELAEKNELPYKGKTVRQLAKDLAVAGVEPE